MDELDRSGDGDMTSARHAIGSSGSAEEVRAIERVATRLKQRLPNRAEADIERAIESEYRNFDRCSIRDFVPVLVERLAREQLQNE
jgi:hypothetical protein